MNFFADSDLQHSISLGEPRAIDLSSIETELASLWRQAVNGGEDSETPTVVRACSLNFVVVADNDKNSAAIDRLLGEITVAHPSRVFLVTAVRETASPSLEAWVSARCSVPLPGEKQVCSEQINLVANGTDVSKVSSIITSLLVPDVPLVLLWKTRVERNDHVLKSLVGIADHVVLDSADHREPLGQFIAWQQLVQNTHALATYADLAWAKLAAWRNVLADTFEPPILRKQLRGLTHLHVEYASGASTHRSGLSQSFLLIGWLARSLGWTRGGPATDGSSDVYTAKFKREGGSVDVRITPRNSQKNSDEGIESITIETGENVSVRLESDRSATCVQVTKRLGNGPGNTSLVSVRCPDDDELLAHQLEMPGTDELYVDSMRWLMSSRVGDL